MKQYLGDGVYVEIERGMLKLTTDDGTGPDNTIYLEPTVYCALHNFVQKRATVDVSQGGIIVDRAVEKERTE